MKDSILRGLYGTIWCWPAMSCIQKLGVESALTICVLLTIWMTIGWWLWNLGGTPHDKKEVR